MNEYSVMSALFISGLEIFYSHEHIFGFGILSQDPFLHLKETQLELGSAEMTIKLLKVIVSKSQEKLVLET